MFYSATARANAKVDDLTDSRAVVAGGTQGIGAGIALRFALAGASVWVVGRSEERGKEVVKALHAASLEGQRRRATGNQTKDTKHTPDHDFLQADLSDVEQIKGVADTINQRAGRGGVDWLFESQGGPPTGNAPDTPAGIDSAFAVQCLSRYGLAKRLLQAGTIKQGVCTIAVPGQGGKKPVNLDDIECRTTRSRFFLNVPRAGARDSAVLDAMTQHFAETYPHLAISHVFPGIIGTKAAANQGFPFPIPQVYSLFGLILPSGRQFAELPFYLYANPEGQTRLHKGQANLFWPWFSQTTLSPNVTDKAHRDAIIAKLDSYGV